MSAKVCTGTISLECHPKPPEVKHEVKPTHKPKQPTFYYLLAVLGILVLTGANAANYYSGGEVCPTNDCHEPEVRFHKRILKHGSRGADVKKLQKLLNAQGVCPEPIALDGIFGRTTLDAVKIFQRQANLPVDGIVGGKTWDRLFASS
ncbi:peptidoglycan-binding protein [Lyngbya sp. CCAP 1446/10]|uniref:peptidoglycan-binding domain-containing protein n=1 Tax=Lyngbya sp. CCAP 1446/10 TaxID=439293 RepID=UPI0022376EB6|nr:peptidoglycan-binding domain-containing protein [Lyngbya sp. CCAP 1446/10]MCW6049475.1 peptidoglycan-binding protein [Lyngbya sp. CCAP 1446/10]